MNTVRCIVCDIDHTLAVKGGMLMPLTKKSLTVAHERGIKIGLASGREIDRKLINQDVIWDLDFKFDFIIGMNGGQVRDIENNNYYSVDLMDIDYMKKIISSVNDIVMDNKIAVNVEGGDNMYAININEELIAVQKRKGVVYLDASDNIDLLCSKPAYKFLFRSTKENCELIRKRVKKFYPEDVVPIFSKIDGDIYFDTINGSEKNGESYLEVRIDNSSRLFDIIPMDKSSYEEVLNG